ncbi:MAG: hypothetical protein LBF15_02325 [Candidatus Peribacteria bacterium]|jgi:hypothetical protein|nr:hypothetical protein [Candidatus Peribacteria bacterium]
MVTADELRNIRDDLVAGTAVNLSGGTRVYTTNSRAVLGYLDNNTSEVQSIIIPANSYAELKTSLKVTNVI